MRAFPRRPAAATRYRTGLEAFAVALLTAIAVTAAFLASPEVRRVLGGSDSSAEQILGYYVLVALSSGALAFLVSTILVLRHRMDRQGHQPS